MKRKIGLVGCVKMKSTSPAPAKDLYTSPLFRGRRRYVEQSCEDWVVLSALHGAVSPDSILEPYDATLKQLPVAARRQWSERVLRALRERYGDLGAYDFEIHAGIEYRNNGLTQGLRKSGSEVEVIGEGLSQGRLLAFYKEASWRA